MSCVFAFLLSTVGRFVLVGMDPGNNHYSVHEAPGLKTFPLLEKDHHIFTVIPRFQSHGTYHSIYCSFRLTQSDIVRIFDEKISHYDARSTEVDLSDTNRESEDYRKKLFSIEEDQYAEKRCLKYMEKITRITDKNYMSDSRLKLSCSVKAMASLAFKGQVGIDGDYRCFAPKVNSHTYLITADKPIHMSDLLSIRPLLHHQRSPSLTSALVWYQGNLLVFKKKTVHRESKWAFQAVPVLRNIKPSVYTLWNPITDIGSKSKYGSQLSAYMSTNYPCYKLVYDDMVKNSHVGKWRTENGRTQSSLEYIAAYSATIRQIKNCMKLYKNLFYASDELEWFCI
ncbi:unnamed protein product [Blumeria hordei]|uniref:Uncharacterized protein n=2 Tax=Blumeria hordei TaxID=2867405 RepID=A0A383UK63_BLUHO|nr:CSEP0482 putative effector protein [Blumeria hordei DH14]SZF00704.1 unnamed protein product [Blumeria hordei]